MYPSPQSLQSFFSFNSFMALFKRHPCILKLSCIYFYLVFPQVFPLPFFLHPAGVGRHDGYFDLFSPSFLPHDLYPPFPSGALQSTQPVSLPLGPERLNHLCKDSSSFKSFQISPLRQRTIAPDL